MHATEPSPGDSTQLVPVSADSLLHTLLHTLEDVGAIDVVTIPLDGKSSIADYMIVCEGRSTRQVTAIADHLIRALKDAGHGRARVEGLPQADWVLIDAGDVIIHVFRPEVREFYNLEKMWAAELNDAHVTH